MQELISIYEYYEDMMKVYDAEEKTEYNLTKYRQFKKLRDAVAREIEIQM